MSATESDVLHFTVRRLCNRSQFSSKYSAGKEYHRPKYILPSLVFLFHVGTSVGSVTSLVRITRVAWCFGQCES